MNFKTWQSILDENEMGDALYEGTWNLNYAHSISLTVEEIREIAEILKRNDKNKNNKVSERTMFIDSLEKRKSQLSDWAKGINKPKDKHEFEFYLIYELLKLYGAEK